MNMEEVMREASVQIVNERATRLKEKMLQAPEICIERGYLLTESYRETENEPHVIRRAKGLAKVLNGMTLGGIYVGGAIAPRIITALDKGRFMERFIKRGKMETMLARIPVGIIIEEKTALLGAASIVMGM